MTPDEQLQASIDKYRERLKTWRAIRDDADIRVAEIMEAINRDKRLALRMGLTVK